MRPLSVKGSPNVAVSPNSILRELGMEYVPTPGVSSGGSAGPERDAFNWVFRVKRGVFEMTGISLSANEACRQIAIQTRDWRTGLWLDFPANQKSSMLPDVSPATQRMRTPGSARQTRNMKFASGILRIWPKMLNRMALWRHLHQWHERALFDETDVVRFPPLCLTSCT